MLQHRVGHAEVAFGIFEVDRVDLVRHGRGADLASLGALLEVAERDITPDVAAQVQQDRVGAGDRVEHLGHIVMRLDLYGVRIKGQSQAFLYDFLREGRPVDFRVGRQVRIVVADRAVHLRQYFHIRNARRRAAQARHHIGHFLAQRGRAGRLAMGARHHGRRRMFMRQVGQPVDQRLQGGQQHGVARRFEHHAVRGVVDVFRGAGEMDELAGGHQFRHVLDLFLQPVLDRFHVVVGDRFNLLDALGVGFGEVGGDPLQQRAGCCRKRLDFGQSGRRQRLQPCNFHFDTVMHETGFGQDGAQFVGLGGVAPVERGKCCQGRKRHGGEE